jgi:MFS family permease
MQISLLEGLADIKDVLMSSDVGPRAASAPPAISRLGPFRHASFTALWIATIVSNIGGWMYSAASGWLMTSLSPDPFTVSLVQVAVSLPMFLLAIPAGALADIVDLRKLLIGTEIAIAVVSAAFALIVWLDAATVANLLLFTFLNGVLGVLQAPAWQAVVPQLVPPQSLQGAIAANSVGINISRAVGPALGGMILARFGLAVPFFVNAVSYLGMVGVLFCWRPPQRGRRHLPVEQFGSAIRTGFRHARNNPHLQATMIRGAAFFLFATAYWALLPLIAREQIAGGPELYGVILGVIGVGAVGGAFALRWMESKLGADWLVAAGTIGTVIAMVLFACARPGAGAFGKHHRRRRLDYGRSDPERIGAGRVARLGARPRAGDVCNDFFWRHGGRQRHLGSNRQHGGPAGRSIHCCRGRARGHSPDLALEAGDGGQC